MMKRPVAFKRAAIVTAIYLIGLSLSYIGGVLMFPLWQGGEFGTAEFSHLRQESERLRKDIRILKVQHARLQHRLDTAEWRHARLYGMPDGEKRAALLRSVDLPEVLSAENTDIQQAYQRLVLEKRQWDRFLQDRYSNVLDSTIEPFSTVDLVIDSADHREYFDELTEALDLHRKLIRDVRMFHDEIQFQTFHSQDALPYKAYDYKLKLDPFARESSIADAMQQAVSALSVGIYQEEAIEVLDRLGDELTRPVRQAYENLLSIDGEGAPVNYNFNIYVTFGKKVMDYTDTLTRQTSIPLAPSALGELDYLYRRLYQSFYDLYEIGTHETIESVYLDMEALEHTIQ